MLKQWQAINQTVITSGCLQMVYLSGVNLSEQEFEPIQAYSEYLDIWIVFDGELSVKVFNQTRQLHSDDVFFYTRSTYAEIAISSTHFSGVRLRYLKDKLPSLTARKRFAASMLHCHIVNQTIKNHCLTFLQLAGAVDGSSNDWVSPAELAVIQKQSFDILSSLEHMIKLEHESLSVVPQNIAKVPLVVSAIDILESNIKSTPKIKSMVEQLGVSHSYFVRIFKKHVGVAPTVFSRVLRVNYSLTMISSDIESLSDVSYSLGFSDQSHFSNSFREALKFTPGTVPVRTL